MVTMVVVMVGCKACDDDSGDFEPTVISKNYPFIVDGVHYRSPQDLTESVMRQGKRYKRGVNQFRISVVDLGPLG